jgi:hypothetical protein
VTVLFPVIRGAGYNTVVAVKLRNTMAFPDFLKCIKEKPFNHPAPRLFRLSWGGRWQVAGGRWQCSGRPQALSLLHVSSEDSVTICVPRLVHGLPSATDAAGQSSRPSGIELVRTQRQVQYVPLPTAYLTGWSSPELATTWSTMSGIQGPSCGAAEHGVVVSDQVESLA